MTNNNQDESSYFSRPFDPLNPGLILFLIDQSASMNDLVGGIEKSKIAATAVNRTIERLVERCRRAAVVVEKVFIGVIGYGANIRFELSQSVVQLDHSSKGMEVETKEIATPAGGRRSVSTEYKVWIDPRAENSTPMAEALELAADKLTEWVKTYPDAPPPVVINVTDGVPNDLQEGGVGSATKAAAAKLRGSDGKRDRCLLLSVHIGDSSAGRVFPAARNEVRGRYEQLLFDISSVLPDELLELAKKKKLTARSGSRLMAVNASPAELLKILDFGSSTRIDEPKVM